jgi:formate-dependent nitrite reductase cytochrome c552 subunit
MVFARKKKGKCHPRAAFRCFKEPFEDLEHRCPSCIKQMEAIEERQALTEKQRLHKSRMLKLMSQKERKAHREAQKAALRAR